MSGGSPVAPTIAPAIDRQVSGSGSIPRRVSVEEGYKRWAATYDRTPNPLLALEQRCLLPLIPDLAGKRVLDLFDLAICSFAVEHIRNMSEVAAEWSRVLKQSADLFITGLHPAAYATGWRAGFRDGQDAIQIDAVPHSAMEMVAVFRRAGFELGHTMECFVGEPEHPLFACAGKERLFDAARGVPAIMISHFRRCSRASELQPPGIDCLVLEES